MGEAFVVCDSKKFMFELLVERSTDSVRTKEQLSICCRAIGNQVVSIGCNGGSRRRGRW